MRVWKVVVLVDLALLLGMGLGYVWWGRHVAALERERDTARDRATELAREVTAARGAGAATGEQEWRVHGVVRAVVTELNVLVITHEDIPGYMPAMTMGFRTLSPSIRDTVKVGDTVRFTLRGVPPNVTIVGIEKTG